MCDIDRILRRSIGDVAEVIAQATDPAKYVGFGFNQDDKHQWNVQGTNRQAE